MKANAIYKPPAFTSRSFTPVAHVQAPTFFSSLICSRPQFSPLLGAHCGCQARRRNSADAKPAVKHEDAEEEAAYTAEEEEEVFEEDIVDGDGSEIDDLFDDEIPDEDNNFEDETGMEESDPYAGDGGARGGVSLRGTSWGKEALALAEEVCISLGGELKIYAFKTSATSSIQVRIENLSNKSGSPSMSDLEAFSTAYRSRLAEAANAGTIPDDLSLEVSSPGVERVVHIPEDLERFKERTMFVKYLSENGSSPGSLQEGEGIFRLVSYNLEAGYCIWGVADVRVNREKAGKGRPLTKKQKEWRLQTPFQSLRLVRLYSEC